jgi:hypothetical protein
LTLRWFIDKKGDNVVGESIIRSAKKRQVFIYLIVIILIGAVTFEAFFGYNQISLLKNQSIAIKEKENETEDLLNQITTLQMDLVNVKDDLNSLQEQIDEIESQKLELKSEIDSIELKIDAFKQEDVLKPSYEEFSNWLDEDDTDKQRYKLHIFDCDDYTAMLIERGEMNGWNLAWVYFWDEEKSAHVLCAIELKDRGLVWIEPQKDLIFDPKKIGENYLPGWEIGKIDYLQIIW